MFGLHSISIDSLTPAVMYSLNAGYPIIMHTTKFLISELPYCGNDYPYNSGHYICVIGFDPITKNFILSDCNFDDDYFGIHKVSIDSFDAAMYYLILFT